MPPKHRDVDWVQVLINVTLAIAAVAFLLLAGVMAWALY